MFNKLAGSGSALLASFTVSLSALAQNPAPLPEPQPAGYPPPPADRPGSAQQGTHEAEHDLKSVAIEANPLGLFIGHYSVNVEWMPALHHALVVNPHYDSVSAGVTVSDGSSVSTFDEHFSGGGAELGYRFYTGKAGPNGFFAGPSLLLGAYTASSSDFTGSEATNFSRIGFAVDIGGQAVLDSGFLIGGGFGLQRTWVNGADEYTGDLPLSAELLVGGGVRPRFLFSMGYAF